MLHRAGVSPMMALIAPAGRRRAAAALRRRLSDVRGWNRIPRRSGGGGGGFGGDNLAIWGLIGANALTMLASEFGDRRVRRFLHDHFRSSAADALQRPHALILTCVLCRDVWDLLGVALGVYFVGSQLMLPALGPAGFVGFYFASGAAGHALAAYYAERHRYLPKPQGLRVSLGRYSPVEGSRPSLTAMFTYATLTAPAASVYLYGILPVPLGLVGAAWIGWPIYEAWTRGVRDANAVSHVGAVAAGAVALALL